MTDPIIELTGDADGARVPGGDHAVHQVRFVRRHPVLVVGGGLCTLFAATVALVAFKMFYVPDVATGRNVPTAPKLTPSGAGQVVYRIDASRSTVSYEVQETLAGTSHTATGSTRGVAGDILVDAANPKASKAGQIVVNVQQLTSDERLRDLRLQNDYLESARHPLATLDTTSIIGLPDTVKDGVESNIEIRGDLTVKTVKAPVVFTGTATREAEQLRVSLSAKVKLSTYGIGPISIAGFVSTSDEAILKITVVAVDASKGSVPGEVAAPGRPVSSGAPGPSFNTTVKPILEKNCASCHGSGGVGAQVWKLDTAGDAEAVASGLSLVTGSRYMPPWPASDKGIAMAHSTKLSAGDVDAITSWAKSGGAIDVDRVTPIKVPATDPSSLRGDLDLPMAEPYAGSTSIPNDYRCFLIDPKFTSITSVTGYQFVPDRREVVHHALAFRVDADKRDALLAKDASEGGPGWRCYGGIGLQSDLTPSGSSPGVSQFMAYAPGQTATRFPDGAAMKFNAGDLVVLQIHYHYGTDAPADRSKVVFDLAKGDAHLGDVKFETYLAPADIPCRAGDTAPLCERDAVIKQIEERYGPVGPLAANGLHVVCRTKIEDVKLAPDATVGSSCDHKVKVSAEVIGIFGHMHEIGKAFRMTLNPGTPGEKVLLDIPSWSFAWQMNFVPAERLEIQKGDVIRIECTWDRGLVKGESRYITWAEGTEDEMCYSALTTIPRN